ncbi:MAG: phosphoribosylglycinamide formyltransferase [Deltaproteobacteria bacterium]|nr:phosphoribosylglycinamide formyltransferase [Deltaproteobacteria bacterium]
MIKIAILVSGNGTNLQSIINAVEAGAIDAKIAVVISNNPNAFALERAVSHNIPTEVLPNSVCPSREEYDQKVIDILKSRNVELIVLAGFMRIITATLINAFPVGIMNIHPALLPAFPGLNVQKKAIEHGVKFSGATVHFVDEGVDTGPIIIQAVVPVHDDDTEETLAVRILKEEHRIYPQAIQFFAEGKLEIDGRRVIIKDSRPPEEAIENPEVTIVK